MLSLELIGTLVADSEWRCRLREELEVDSEVTLGDGGQEWSLKGAA